MAENDHYLTELPNQDKDMLIAHVCIMIVPEQNPCRSNHALHLNLPERKLPVYVPQRSLLINENIQTVCELRENRLLDS